MKSIKTRSHVGNDGILHLDIPVGVQDKEFEVMVIYQPIESSRGVKTPLELGWLPGFFEEVIGGWVGEPLVREPQGEYETREQMF
ncbi:MULTISPECIES: hypothetical protein [unclassified Coleofasciculus]|uniref:hypothetical protein n=1 Tax=unclassified Coleofasciculus TaxID=2692782 RepID=UPI00187F6D2E|nr:MULTISPECIES: hypothetical protein [unclassified Coleofasciculus]MBE9130005.1 hypothetical protein [Coleofasciculus sp. LEGE 07081]MBE9152367.1 hypothetical protein [Coleofasciculus sp. LEGE 07092]